MLGRSLDGRFTIVARLGAGSMGTVYRARQHAVGREVAVKILRSDRALDQAAKGRFLREARANSALTSPNTVTVFDFGQCESGELYLAMELLEGESLGQRLKRVGRLTVEAAVDMTRQALRSLAEAHAKGIIHRDLKPDNLFFARAVTGGRSEETVKLVDFGIAKMMNDENMAMNAVETQAGTVFGTPRYMSPEQAQGKTLDARSDLYSLGVILYHCLAGRPPFTDDDAIVVMARHIKTPPRPLSEVAPDALIPQDVENVVMRALSKDPHQRPETAEHFAQELGRALEAGIAATSGVRSISAVPAAVRARMAAAPTAADESLTAPAGLPSRAGRVALLAVLAVALIGGLTALAVVLRARTMAPRAIDEPRGGRAVAGDSTGVRGAPQRVDNPAPQAVPASPPTGNPIPTIAASALPIAGPARAPAPPVPPTRATARPASPSAPGTAPAPAPAPKPTATYGLFE